MICDVSYNHKNSGALPPKMTSMYDAFEDDIGIVNIFFVDSTIKKFITSHKMSVFDYITEIGGSLGLFMGISIISVIEFIYWFLTNFYMGFQN